MGDKTEFEGMCFAQKTCYSVGTVIALHTHKGRLTVHQIFDAITSIFHPYRDIAMN